ncbi:MAG: hypothetical protein IJN62_01565, partial [Clostridia bacterium]|nr:hypothetical protein [Clostridia bacterium]
MKKISIILLVIILSLSSFAPAYATNWSSTDIKVAVNKESIVFPDQKPILDSDTNRTYVPVRFLAENLGAEVDWDNEHQVVIIKNKYIEGD